MFRIITALTIGVLLYFIKVSDNLRTEHRVRKKLYIEDIGGNSTMPVKL